MGCGGGPEARFSQLRPLACGGALAGSELLYLHSGAWVPDAETGVRFDDPQLAIRWPLPPQGMSERDLVLPLLELLLT